jgi:hypothetical protein
MPTVTVTFTPSNPNQKINCNPDAVHVPFGNGQNVTWNLNGPAGAVFGTDGIYFKNGSPGTLSRTSDTSYSLDDDNDNTSGQDVVYAYGVNISYQGNNYSIDPEVENDPGHGPLELHYKPA